MCWVRGVCNTPLLVYTVALVRRERYDDIYPLENYTVDATEQNRVISSKIADLHIESQVFNAMEYTCWDET